VAIFLFANDASSTLAAPISSTAISVTLASGTGALFPNPSAGQQFARTFNDAATGLLTEIVYCTARSGDTLTIVRAQEGTIAQNWLAGDLAANLATEGQMAAMQQTAALSPARTVTTSGAFTLTNADSGGGVGLKRVVSPGVSSTTLPGTATDGMTFWIEDLAKNFNTYPVTVTYPGGTMGPDGTTTATLNVNGQCAQFRLYQDSNTWSFKP
jgi:hypothetical protein